MMVRLESIKRWINRGLLCLLLLLPACVNETTPAEEEYAIGFKSAVKGITKGGITTTENIREFKVNALATTGDLADATDLSLYMENVTVSRVGTSNVWSYDPAKIWPNNKKLSFFASAPIGVKVEKATEGDPQLTFQAPLATDEQVDLLVAKSVDMKGGIKAPAVELQFEHVLTRIGLKVKLDGDYINAKVKIKSAQLKQVYSTGVLYWKSTPIWNLFSDVQNYTYVAKDVVCNSTTAVDMGNYFMLVPQPLTQIALVINYEQTVNGVTTTGLTYTKALAGVIGVNWECGTQLTYLVTFKGPSTEDIQIIGMIQKSGDDSYMDIDKVEW